VSLFLASLVGQDPVAQLDINELLVLLEYFCSDDLTLFSQLFDLILQQCVAELAFTELLFHSADLCSAFVKLELS
jgi:hypothetical protein